MWIFFAKASDTFRVNFLYLLSTMPFLYDIQRFNPQTYMPNAQIGFQVTAPKLVFAKEVVLFVGKIYLCPQFWTQLSTYVIFPEHNLNKRCYIRCNSALSSLSSLFTWLDTETSLCKSAEFTQLSPPKIMNWSQDRDFQQTMWPQWNTRLKRGEGNLFGPSFKYSMRARLHQLVIVLIKVCLFSSLSYTKWITLGIMFGFVSMPYLPKWIWGNSFNNSAAKAALHYSPLVQCVLNTWTDFAI